MPWVRLDDRFPSHRKVALLSDRAFRLHVSALCWASENLTEGKILDSELRVIAHVRGMKAAAKELEERKLWDRIDDGWVIHDFLEYNPDRVKVQTERENNAARQQAFRDRKKAERDAKAAAEKAAREAKSNAVTPPVTYSVSNGTPAPAPSPGTSFGSTSAAAPARDPLALDTLADLKAAISASGLSGFSWRLQASQIERTRRVVDRVGVQQMVDLAVGNAQLKGVPANASAWIVDWETLEPAAPRQPSAPRLPAAVGDNVIRLAPGQRPATSDVRFQQAVETGRRLQAIADAKRNQQEQS